MNDKKSTCCTCGYKWLTGAHGGHSCSRELLKQIELKRSSIEDLIKTLKHKRVSEEFVIDSLERLIKTLKELTMFDKRLREKLITRIEDRLRACRNSSEREEVMNDRSPNEKKAYEQHSQQGIDNEQ